MKKNFLKEFWKENKKGYFISTILVSLGAVFIHLIQNNPPNWQGFFLWLPTVWLFVLIFALMLGIIGSLGEK